MEKTAITSTTASLAWPQQPEPKQFNGSKTKDWQPFWAIDPDATQDTECGSVPTTAAQWLAALAGRPSKWVDHHTTQGIARATGYDVLIFVPNPEDTTKWLLRDRQRALPGIDSQPILLLLQREHFTTIFGKAAATYTHMAPPPGPNLMDRPRFHGSGADPPSPATSSWCRPPPSNAPTSSSWCRPPQPLADARNLPSSSADRKSVV